MPSTSRKQVDAWARSLCAKPEVACARPEDLHLYAAPGDPPGTAWAILGTAPVLLKLGRDKDAGWNAVSRWDFSGCRPAGDAGASTALYTGVPFACEALIRACFTEEDYRTLRDDCHDHYEGYLTLAYAASSAPGRYAWTADWHPSVAGGGAEGGRTARLPPTGGDATPHFAGIDTCSVQSEPYSRER